MIFTEFSPFDAGERLHHVVADVLRETPVDADQRLVQLAAHGGDQFGLGAADGTDRAESATRDCGFSGTKNSAL